MKRLIGPLALLPLCLALALPAAAQDGFLELTVFGGYRSGGDFTTTERVFDRYRDRFTIEDADVYGATLDIPLSRSFAVELLYSRQDSQLSIDEGVFAGDIPLADLEVSYYQAGVRWQWAPGQVQPYLAAGLGWARLAPKDSDLETENRFAGSLAVGLKVMPSRHVGIRIEGRGYFADLSNYEDYDCRYCNNGDDDLYQVEATGGIVFAF